MAFTTAPLYLATANGSAWVSSLFQLATTLDPAPSTGGGTPPFGQAWKTNDGDLSVTFDSSTGGNAVLCRAESIVIAQQESATQTITITMRDEDYEFHPEGNGAYKDVMADGAEVSVTVVWGGHSKTFFGYFKAPGVTRNGSDNIPTITWVGTCVGDKLGRVKKTFATIAPNSSATAPTNKAVLDEMATAVGISGDWTRIKTSRIGTPFHRQNLLPGDILQKMLDLTVDEWRTENKTLVAYDPEKGGRRWEYEVDTFTNDRRDVVFEHQITPQNNDKIDKVIVLRAVSTGTLISTGDSTVETRLLTFGSGNTVNFDPPLSGIAHRYKYRDHRGIASYFLYYSGATLIAVRGILNPLDYSDMLKRARIWNCTSVSFTWGASSPDVDAGLLEAEGAIEFYGSPSPQTTVGEGEDANGPLDTTTRLPVGDGENEIELPPNPLFYGQSEMAYFGAKYLRRVGRQQVDHQYRLPLNHMLQNGDIVAIRRDSLLGGSGFIEVRVTAYSHSVSAFPEQRFTQITGVKYV